MPKADFHYSRNQLTISKISILKDWNPWCESGIEHLVEEISTKCIFVLILNCSPFMNPLLVIVRALAFPKSLLKNYHKWFFSFCGKNIKKSLNLYRNRYHQNVSFCFELFFFYEFTSCYCSSISVSPKVYLKITINGSLAFAAKILKSG